jgi:transcriptional regulator with XRE-family HTH domain
MYQVSGRQVRAARAGLGLTVAEVAELSGLSTATVQRAEAGALNMKRETLDAILGVLELRGARFFASGVSFPPGDVMARL